MIKSKYVFENDNGNTYAILKRKGDLALLKCLNSGQIVIARGLNESAHCWAGGSYWGEDLDGALQVFNQE